MNTPGFPGLPLHKQMLLSPLLAQSHLWQQMAAQSRQYSSPLSPLFAGLANPAAAPTAPAAPTLPIPKPTPSKPEVVDVMAEHKALMERFASQMNAAALAAAAAQQAAQAAQSDEEKEEPVKPKPLSNPNIPMDLSSRIAAAACKEDDDEDLDVGHEDTDKEVKKEESEDVAFKKIVIKSDLNRNTVLQDSDKE